MTLKIAVNGAAGRMGKTLIEAINLAEGCALGAAFERPGSSLLGADAGELAGIGRNGVAVTDNPAAALEAFDVLIDFSALAATLANARLCAANGKGLVIGTTGFTPEQRAELVATLAPIPACMSS